MEIYHIYIFDGEIIPKGLQIKLTPQTSGVKSKTFLRKWDNILFECLMRLMGLLYNQGLFQLGPLKKNIEHTLEDCQKNLSGRTIRQY